MSEYQAVYDAVRSRFHNCDAESAVGRAASEAFSNAYLIPEIIRGCMSDVANEMMRPYVLLRPKIYIDGNQWCVMYGENLQDGVSGFGDTPAEAAANFDAEWLSAKIDIQPAAELFDGVNSALDKLGLRQKCTSTQPVKRSSQWR